MWRNSSVVAKDRQRWNLWPLLLGLVLFLRGQIDRNCKHLDYFFVFSTLRPGISGIFLCEDMHAAVAEAEAAVAAAAAQGP